MKTSIATVSLSGDLREKLAAISAAGFGAIEIFENDFLAFDRGAREVGRMVRDAGLIAPRHFVAEIVYFPLETELLRLARAKGCRTVDGGGMAVFQAAGAFELFTGIQPDPERMLAHFAQMGA